MIFIILASSCLLFLVEATLPGTAGSVPLPPPRQLGVHAPGINGQAEPPTPVETYLTDFGYTTKRNGPEPPSPFDFQMGLLRFQLYHGLYRSGLFDDETEEKMTLHRCENSDMQNGAALKAHMLLHPKFRSLRLRLNRKFMRKLRLELRPRELWRKKVLKWTITGQPNSLTHEETRDAAVEAFSRWQGVADFRFVEVQDGEAADIVITFEAMNDKKHATVVARASGPEHSRIVLDRNQGWSHRTHRAGSLPLYRALLHEIGHALGLQHTPEIDSLMTPLFTSAQLFSKVLAIPTEDNIALRKLYGMSVPVGVDSAADAAKLKCPKYLDSVTAVDADTWFFFKDYSVYRIQSQKIVGQPVRIKEMFPRGPDFINATVTSNGLTLLFAERTIYGYEYEDGRFSEAEGFPRELHERVLFFPQAAFPLSNGSVVLLSGNVFATYNVLENVPSILNDKNRVFPNLPYDLRSGIPVHPNDYSKYYMFDETTVAGWNSITHQADEPQPITEFFKCDN